MKIFYLYKITNKINNRFYIGVHCHKSPYFNSYMGSGKLIKHAIKKYGVENFLKEILEIFDNGISAYEKERIIVNYNLINDPKCYNMKVGGQGGRYIGYQCSEETKRKIGESNKGKKRNKEFSQKIREINCGKVLSEETKRKIGDAQRGKVLSEETKRKIGDSKLKNTYMLGKNQTEETKRKIGDAQRGELNHSYGKRVFHHKQLKISKLISSSEIEPYIKEGWELGRLPKEC